MLHLNTASVRAARPAWVVFGGRRPKVSSPVAQDRVEFYQGAIPNCQFLAAVLMVLQADPRAIEKMKTLNPDGGYTVRFPGAPNHPVVISPDEFHSLPWGRDERPAQVKGPDDIRLIETAYAKVLKRLYAKRFKQMASGTVNGARELFRHPDFDPERFTTAFALNLLTGQKAARFVKTDPFNTIARTIQSYFADRKFSPPSFSEQKHETDRYEERVRHYLKRFAKHPGRYAIALVTNPAGQGGYSIDWGGKLPAYHVLVVDRVNLADRQVTLRDPHNTRYALVIPFEDAVGDFFKMYVFRRGQKTPSAPRAFR